VFDLSVVIVSWNTLELLGQCLASVTGDPELAIRGPNAPGGEPSSVDTGSRTLCTEILVLDNASTDGSPAMVRERFPWVCLIESQTNLGFAAGNNLALRKAMGAHILLLNPDTVVTQGAIARLWHVLAAHPKGGIAGGQLLNADGSPQMSYGAFPSLWTELPLINRRLQPVRRRTQIDAPDARLAVQAVDWVSGACLMIKQEVMQQIGPLDESFWMYTEETDWCYRARAAGWEVLFVPEAQITHLARAASRQRFVLTMLCFYQSRVRFVRKHYGSFHATLVRDVLRLKTAIWRRDPSRSPLHGAYPDLPLAEISSAYRKLAQVMALPLDQYLASDWK
jgi:N-acetylglucosaminyl-diphospho-decaprenol L-rhamnosyltransferase